ncbi:MAG: SprB repeat-containing protein, partial [Bacteroidota bacterium]
ISFTAQTNVSCFAGNDGAVTASPSGGTSGYTYLWASGGTTTATKTNLTAGTYSVTITDSQGCIATNSVVITQPLLLSASTSTTNETCNYSNDGTATAIVSGGTSDYTYLWQPGGLTSISINNLSSGTYTLTVTDAKGCTATTNAIIAEPAPLTINFTPSHVSCFAGSNGTLTASPTGGTPNYSYLWASGGATTASVSNLTAGTYTVTVTDNLGCVETNSAVITQPTIVLASTSVTNETCNYLNNGTAAAVSSGGTGSYTYLWQPGLQTTSSISNLSSGTYTLTVTDSNGCTAIANAIITEPAPIVISFTAQTNVSCFAGNDGAITASPSGGTSGYTYLWASGGTTTATKTNLTAGTYSVTITDSQGCIATNSVVITQPLLLSASTTKTNETCNYSNNGTATAAVSGGTSGYTYLWMPGAQTTSVATGLSAGTYTVTATDAKGCIATANAIIAEPAPLAINFTGQINVSCFAGNDGSVSATPSGGTPNYTYLWAPGGTTTSSKTNLAAGTYTNTVTDSRGCIVTNSVTITQALAPLSVSASSLPVSCNGGSNGSVSAIAANGTGPYTFNWMPGSLNGQNVPNLAAGTYTVTATDSLGCISSNTVSLTQPAKIILITASVNSDCGQPNGESSVSVSGGNAPYTYFWSPSGGTNAIADSLVSGAYTVIVTDSTGCISTQFGNVNENSAPVATIFSVINVSCFGGATGSAQVGTSGGIGPFTYSWMPTGGTDSIAAGLTAGTYTVTVTGSNGCQSLATTSPDITQPPPILITVTKSRVSCFGGNDGGASAIASGGTPGFTYQWLPGGTTGSSVTNLSAITYTVQVTDSNNCVQTMPFTIAQPPAPLSASLSFTPSNCFAGSDGSVSATATGGTVPYNYNWMPGNLNGPTLSNLSSGTYTLTVTDIKGCVYTDSISITQPTPLLLSTDSINSNCSLANGQASVIASGGTGTYLYQWLPSGGTNASATALFSGPYTITVTDANGCISTKGVTVNDNASPVATVTATTNVSCNNGSNGTATVSVAGGAGPFTYLWSPAGGTNATATGLLPGTYTVTVTDINLCQSIPAISTEITQPSPILITVTKTNVSCFGGTNGTASAIASGGTSGYTYQWLPSGTTGGSITNLSATTYTIQVTDLNSCIETLPFTITQPAAPLSAPLSSSPVSCYGGMDGSVSALAAGGTAPYNYSWMPGNSNGPVFSNVAMGTYTVSITDFNGCTFSNSISVT